MSDTELTLEEQEQALIDLKNKAKILGMDFHPNIKYKTLSEKIKEFQAAQPEEEVSLEKEVVNNKDGLELVRVRVANMDPQKQSYSGEIFCTGNSVLGTVKRYVPFNIDWHVPQILLNMIEQRQHQTYTTKINSRGQEIKNSVTVKTYGIERLPDLTLQELKELKQRQLMAKGQED